MSIIEPSTVTGAGGVLAGMLVILLRDAIKGLVVKRNGTPVVEPIPVHCPEHENLVSTVDEIRRSQQKLEVTLRGVHTNVKWLVKQNGGPEL